MAPSAVQLSFTLRTSANVRTVHLVGSWDGYKSQLPLSLSKDASAKPGSWKGTFRFQGAHALKLGSRYWYYYIVDGYHVSHDPAKEHVVEKTTGRKLNVLNVPAADAKRPAPIAIKPIQTTSGAPKTPAQIATGRALSPTKICHPRPQKPYASQGLREADYDMSPIDDLEERFGSASLAERKFAASPSDLSELSESSGTVFSSSASGSSCTSESEDEHRCKCNRFGLPATDVESCSTAVASDADTPRASPTATVKTTPSTSERWKSSDEPVPNWPLSVPETVSPPPVSPTPNDDDDK